MALWRRQAVTAKCARPCPSCTVCEAGGPDATLEEVLARSNLKGIVLGGGDVTRWPHLGAFLKANAGRAEPQEVWIEAPANALKPAVLDALVRGGVKGVRIQIEALGERMCQILGVGDPVKVLEDVQSRGLDIDVRLSVRPRTFSIIGPIARMLHPRTVWLELVREDWGQPPQKLNTEALEKLLVDHTNVWFSTHRLQKRGYIPPCAAPLAYELAPSAWRSTLVTREQPNDAMAACGTCALRNECHWDDVDAFSPEVLAAIEPIGFAAPQKKREYLPVPDIIVRRRKEPDVICTDPWTTIEVQDPSGDAHQCGGDWTDLVCGNIHKNRMPEIWNGAGFQQARRQMGSASLKGLCNPVCVHLYDQRLHEKRFRIQKGSKAFVDNQMRVAEDIAERREVVTSSPLHVTLSPSSYCNYNCVFCDHGRTPRRDMPDSVWEDLHEWLPTTKTVTLLGGEPFANSKVWDFLVDFDNERAPDVGLDFFTNGSLITEKALSRIKRAPISEITVSLNSGEADVYKKLERGIEFEKVLENVDALIRFRSRYHHWFGITLSFIVQSGNAHTLMQFGEIARQRNLHIRLVTLHVRREEELNFYKDPVDVARVLKHFDEFAEWVRRVRPDWNHQVVGARGAIVGEAEKRQRIEASLVRLGGARSLPVVG